MRRAIPAAPSSGHKQWVSRAKRCAAAPMPPCTREAIARSAVAPFGHQGGGCDTSEHDHLASQVGLVGVASIGRSGGERRAGIRGTNESLEPLHALDDLGGHAGVFEQHRRRCRSVNPTASAVAATVRVCRSRTA